jgi:peptidoglycan/LPS O-acetylase OafA/YrhL
LDDWLRSFTGRSWGTALIFLVVSAGTIIISHFSYRFLEAPYFKHTALLKNKRAG